MASRDEEDTVRFVGMSREIKGFKAINGNISGLRWISVDLEAVKLYCGCGDSSDLGDYERYIGIFGD